MQTLLASLLKIASEMRTPKGQLFMFLSGRTKRAFWVFSARVSKETFPIFISSRLREEVNLCGADEAGIIVKFVSQWIVSISLKRYPPQSISNELASRSFPSST